MWLGVGPELGGEFAQLVLLDLLRGRHREDVHEVDVLRDLEPRNLVVAEVSHVLLFEVVPRRTMAKDVLR